MRRSSLSVTRGVIALSLAPALLVGCADQPKAASSSGAGMSAPGRSAQPARAAESGVLKQNTPIPAITLDGHRIEPLDARLTTYAYPFPTQIFPVDAQGQKLEMIYMDVRAEKPNGRAVLLLHGKNFSAAYWEETIRRLTDKGFRVIAPDQIDFGKSSKPADYQYSFDAMAKQTRDLLRSLGVQKTAVVGHSMGGMLAARYALLYPDATERLALVNPIGLEDWSRMVPYIPIEQWENQELAQTAGGVKKYMQDTYFAGDWKPAYDPLLDILAGWTLGPDRAILARTSARTSDMIFTQPVVHELGDVKSPTLLIIGQRDRTAIGKQNASPEVARTMGDYPALGRAAAAAIPGARLVEIEGVGHVPQVQAFEQYIGALEKFLGE